MRYTVEIDIDLPRDRVIELFDDPDNLRKWQRGLQTFEPLEGEPGRPGARSRLVFRHGKGTVELIETITERSLPDTFTGTYESKGVHNVVANRFVELAPDRTRWISEIEFTFSGFMKVVALLLRGAFRKQSLIFMRDFKAFAEDGVDVNA